MIDVAVLYEQYKPLIETFVRYRVHPNEVDDIVSETFAHAVRSAHQYQDRGYPPSSWLYMIARNLIADHYRHTRGGKAREIPMSDVPIDHVTVVDAGGSRQTDQILCRDLLATLRSEAPKQAAVLELRYVQGLEHQEVADVFAGSIEGSHKLQARGLIRARKIAEGDVSRFGGRIVTCHCGVTFESTFWAKNCSVACKKRAYEHRRKRSA